MVAGPTKMTRLRSDAHRDNRGGRVHRACAWRWLICAAMHTGIVAAGGDGRRTADIPKGTTR